MKYIIFIPYFILTILLMLFIELLLVVWDGGTERIKSFEKWYSNILDRITDFVFGNMSPLLEEKENIQLS